MRNEITATSTRDLLPQEYTCTTVETRAKITETINQLRTMGNEQIALVTIHLYYKRDGKTGQAKTLQAERARQGTAYLLQNIRSLVRKTDRVFLYQHSLYFVLPGANLPGATIVEERLWEALLWRTHNMGEQEALRPLEMTIGHAAYPEPHANLDELLSAADETSKRFGDRSEQGTHRSPRRSAREEESMDQGTKEELPLLAKKLGVPYLSLLPRKLPRHVLQVVNARLAHELRCYPVGRERNMLTVAMLNPQDHTALERLRQETGLRIFPILTHPEALESALEQLN